IKRGWLRLFFGLPGRCQKQAQHHDGDCLNFHCTLTLPLPVTRARKSFPLVRFFTRIVLPVTPSASALASRSKCAPPVVTSTLTTSPLATSGARLSWLRRTVEPERIADLGTNPTTSSRDRAGRSSRANVSILSRRTWSSRTGSPAERSDKATTRVVVVVMRARTEMPKRRLFPYSTYPRQTTSASGFDTAGSSRPVRGNTTSPCGAVLGFQDRRSIFTSAPFTVLTPQELCIAFRISPAVSSAMARSKQTSGAASTVTF